MTTYSYEYTVPTRSAQPAQRMATAAQIKIYNELCTERKITPVDISKLTYDQAYGLIGQTRNHRPASDNQKQTIMKLIEQLQNAGMQIKMPDSSFFDKLTGGHEGTAYKFIEQLIGIQREHDIKQPPTEEQLRYIVSMYFYPDADFESYNVATRIYLDEKIVDAKGNEKQLWRRPSPDEFAALIVESMSRKQCEEFLGKHRVGFNEFKATRIRPQQENRIRQLEERLADISRPREVAFSIDMFGNISETVPTSGREYNVAAYQPIDTLQLKMYSVEEASRHIEMLEADLAKKLGTAIDSADTTLESLRMPRSVSEASAMELKNLDTALYRIEAHTGLTSEEIHVVPYHDEHDRVQDTGKSDVFFDRDNIESKRKRNKIKDYLAYALEQDYITLRTLMRIAEPSETLTEMVEELATKELGIKFRKTKKA